MKKQHKFKDWILDSYLEVYFCYYLQELKDAGYVKEFYNHAKTWDLTPKVTRPYLKQLKTKVKQDEFHLLHPSTYTADFNIVWTKKASNVFFLNPKEPVASIKDIPFKLSTTDGKLVSHIEIKSINESTTSSSVSFPYIQKHVMEKYDCYVEKIRPFASNPKQVKKTLFYNTFIPRQVLKEEIYKRDCKYGKKGQSKIKYPVRSLNEYLKI